MLLNIIKQFNWVDILAVVIFFRILYVAAKNGLPVEFFKLLGTISALYLGLHYYTAASDWLRQRLLGINEKMPLEFLDFLSGIVLVMAGYLIFVLLRSVFYRFIKMEAVPGLSKWGGLVLGFLRAYLLLGLIIFMLVISSIAYFKKSVSGSYSGARLFRVAPEAYGWLWNNLASKFMSQEKFNPTVFEVQEGF